MKKVLVLFGTRPEAIKLAPVVKALQRRPDEFITRVASTGQHREMVQQVIDAFGLQIDFKLDAMSSATSLGHLTSCLFRDLDLLLEAEMPDWILVQGDTTSAMVAAVCAFYRRVKIGHVEAGLRTYDKWAPFPEEINRSFITHVADAHFAPTKRSAENLQRAGIPEKQIYVTGNTVVDALEVMVASARNGIPSELDPKLFEFIENKRMVLVTCHRRESFGDGLRDICRGLLGVVEQCADAVIIYPVHLNPNVYGKVRQFIGKHPRIKLLEPVRYTTLLWLLNRSYFVLTDSGGIQEEAPCLGKPVLVLRQTTERPEAVEAGCAQIVGTNPKKIVDAAMNLFDDPQSYSRMAQVKNPFGDGFSSPRIAEILAKS